MITAERQLTFTQSHEVAYSVGPSSFRRGIFYLSAGRECGDYRLKEMLVVHVEPSPPQLVATPLWSTLQEYGLGDSEEEAIDDLLWSLSGYFNVLKKYELRGLVPESQADLDALRDLLCREEA